MTHTVCILDEFAGDILSGNRTFEIVDNVDNCKTFRKGDYLKYKVIAKNKFKNVDDHELNNKLYEITYIYDGWHLKSGSIALGLKEVKEGGSS